MVSKWSGYHSQFEGIEVCRTWMTRHKTVFTDHHSPEIAVKSVILSHLAKELDLTVFSTGYILRIVVNMGTVGCTVDGYSYQEIVIEMLKNL